MARKRVLVVDDDAGVRFGIREYLSAHDLEVGEAEDCASAEEAVRSTPPDGIVLDYQLPDGTALDLLPRLRASSPELPVVILTAHGSVELAVKAVQAGADQFLTKPVGLEALFVVLERLLKNQRMRHAQALRSGRERASAPDPFLGTSTAIRRFEQEARRALSTASPILIGGETGSGKGVLAGWLHRNGPRADEPFVDLNCAGFSRELLDSELFGHERGAFTGATHGKPGLLEAAHHGTVFLDEVGDLDPVVQAKLLKVLEEKRFRRLGDVRDRQVDIQLIAATHQDLPTLVREKRFREDLYYRLNVIPVRVPALHERAEDVPLLARRIMGALATELGRVGAALSPDAEAVLAAYRWPGNVRELRNVLERALLRSEGPIVGVSALSIEPPSPAAGDPAADLTLEAIERRHIERVLELEGGHVERAARRLGVPRSSLYGMIKKLRIAIPG